MLNQNAITDVRADSKGSAKLLLIGSGGLAGPLSRRKSLDAIVFGLFERG